MPSARERSWSVYVAKSPNAAFCVMIPNGWRGVYAGNWIYSDAPPAYPILPSGYRMASVTLANAARTRHRNWPCSRGDGGNWPPIGATLDLPSIDGTLTAWTVTGYISECKQPLKYRRARRRI